VIDKWLVLTDEGPTDYNSFYDAQEKLTLRHVGVIDRRTSTITWRPAATRPLQSSDRDDSGTGDRRDEAVGSERTGRCRLSNGTEVGVRGGLQVARRGQVLYLQRRRRRPGRVHGLLGARG